MSPHTLSTLAQGNLLFESASQAEVLQVRCALCRPAVAQALS